MPERRDSVDSFDDFFGDSKTGDDRKKSPIKPKQDESTIASMVKTQPVVRRPSTPGEERLPSAKTKPKANNAKTSERKSTSPAILNRPESVQSKVYESDFDDGNGFEDDDETAVESTDDRKKHGSLPPPKQRSSEAPRRGSDSELKSSYVVTRQTKPTNRKEQLLPYIRPQQTRRTGHPIRRHRESAATSVKTEMDQRALSAQNNKLKSLESRLAQLRRELEDQRIENATLRTIQRREEKAIKKYEEKEYDIHRIVRDYTHEIDHMKEVLSTERDTKMRLEKQVEVREEKLRDQTKRLKQYEKVVKEKNLDERYELREKLNETDRKLQEAKEKLANQEKHIDHLEKNYRYEIGQELSKQRDLKRQLETRSQKYNELVLKFEDKTRQVDTMHIYVQRGGKRPSDSPSNLSKSRSLQSLQETSPRVREKTNDYDKKRREEQERKSKPRPRQSTSNDSSLKQEKKKVVPKKEPQQTMTKTKKSSNDEKSSTLQNGHLPPKGKPPARRLSTPKSVEEETSDIEDETLLGSGPKKVPPPTNIQRSEQHLSQAQIHKRPVAPVSSTTESKYKPSGTGENATSSSIFKLTEPPAPSKPRVTRELDDKWSDMFGTNKQEDSTKEDLLAKLVADEQQERKLAAAAQRPAMSMFESSTRSTIQPKTTTTVKPSDDPFESLFNNNSNKPAASRTNDLDDIFSTKPTSQPTTQAKNDSFESLFGPSSTTDNSTTVKPNSKQFPSQNDKLQRPKVVTNATRSIPNRTVVDEVEEFVL